jgi:DNA polymerase V
MPDTTPPKRGGARPGSGRKQGTGGYGEPTEPVRVPVSLLPIVRAWLAAKAKALPAGARLPSAFRPALSLPLFSSLVPAGFPSPADDHLEDGLDLNAHLVQHPAATFLVRVQGESMTGAGIHHGDMLVVDRSLEPKPGDVVVAVVNGELTVKRLRAEAGRIWLAPENPAYPLLEIREGMELVIWGVVAHAEHSFK